MKQMATVIWVDWVSVNQVVDQNIDCKSFFKDFSNQIALDKEFSIREKKSASGPYREVEFGAQSC